MASGKEKKRKREQDGTARPKKKVAIQAASQSAQPDMLKIASVSLDRSCPPVIGERAFSLVHASSSAHCFQRHIPACVFPTPSNSKHTRSQRHRIQNKSEASMLHPRCQVSYYTPRTANWSIRQKKRVLAVGNHILSITSAYLTQ